MRTFERIMNVCCKRILLLMLLLPLWAGAQVTDHCATPLLHRNHPLKSYAPGSPAFEKWLKKAEEAERAARITDNDQVYSIPVVVHVLHFGEPTGTGRNLSAERIQSQIDILNQDFGRLAGTPGFNSHPAGADTRIRFCLATTDPQGNATSGIVRINANQDGFNFQTDNLLLKNLSLWDETRYLNIWTCKILGDNYIGYAQYPFIEPAWADSLPMTQPIPDVLPDGVVSDYRVFGVVPTGESGPFPSYNRGRTVTHEVGHYLGLIHIWGDGTTCSDNATDFCADTPPQETYTSGCPQIPVGSCTPGIPRMQENYMDYTNDVCMRIFTADQKRRMRMVMRNCVRRKSILQLGVVCNPADTQPIVEPPLTPRKTIRIILDKTQILVDAPEDNRKLESARLFSVEGKELFPRFEKNTDASRITIYLPAERTTGSRGSSYQSSLRAGRYLVLVKLSDGGLERGLITLR